MKSNFKNAARWARSTSAKIGAGVSGVMASGLALASGSGSPGSAIAGEVTGGKADMLLVIGACAILLGVLIVWGYTKRSAK